MIFDWHQTKRKSRLISSHYMKWTENFWQHFMRVVCPQAHECVSNRVIWCLQMLMTILEGVIQISSWTNIHTGCNNICLSSWKRRRKDHFTTMTITPHRASRSGVCSHLLSTDSSWLFADNPILIYGTLGT